MQNLDLNPGNVDRWRPVRHDLEGNALLKNDPTEGLIIFFGGCLSIGPYLTNIEIFDYKKETIEVVRMGMGQNDCVEPGDPFVPEIGRQDIFPDIETVVEKSSPINQHFFTARKPDQNAVALTDIHCRHGKVFLLKVSHLEI